MTKVELTSLKDSLDELRGQYDEAVNQANAQIKDYELKIADIKKQLKDQRKSWNDMVKKNVNGYNKKTIPSIKTYGNDLDEQPASYPDGIKRYVALSSFGPYAEENYASEPYTLEEIESKVDTDGAVKSIEQHLKKVITFLSLNGEDYATMSFGIGMVMFCDTRTANALGQIDWEDEREGNDKANAILADKGVTLPYAYIGEGKTPDIRDSKGELLDEFYFDKNEVEGLYYDGTSVVNIKDFIEKLNALGYEFTLKIGDVDKKDGQDIALEEIKRLQIIGGTSFDAATLTVNLAKEKTFGGR